MRTTNSRGMMCYVEIRRPFAAPSPASQVVVHEGVIREKPSSKDEARQFIKGYSGGHVATVGSVVVTNLKTGIRRGGWDKAEIYFHEIPDEVVEGLIEEGTVLYVAGGLMVEHPLTSPFVNAVIVGSQVHVKIVKNKHAPPFKTVQIELEFGKGICRDSEIIELGCKHRFIGKLGGANYRGSTEVAQTTVVF